MKVIRTIQKIVTGRNAVDGAGVRTFRLRWSYRMNTREELDRAFEELDNNTFIKQKLYNKL